MTQRLRIHHYFKLFPSKGAEGQGPVGRVGINIQYGPLGSECPSSRRFLYLCFFRPDVATKVLYSDWGTFRSRYKSHVVKILVRTVYTVVLFPVMSPLGSTD